ncbi:MAG: hypothetical protein CYPHOPRED_003043 [Cyphobasidiales sp. Tagirdzhanova-0007]|nr:MAG: hypothetical protein CYPHOPRED_003043 [Cyphobasidiales sp. Tagirdzhanova-0007]
MEDPALESIQTAENIGSDDTIDDKSLEADPPKAEHGHEDEPLCRICFSGADEEDLGRLISPCLCRGTVAKVHVGCLNRWRTTARSSSSFFQCDQCRYKYRIERAKIAGLAENRYALAALTVLFFFLLVFLNGFIGNWLLRQGNSDSVVSTLFFDGPPESYNTWPYRESYLPLETVGQAVEFASKVADDISLTRHESASALVPDSDAYADSAASPYRMVRSKKRSKRAQTANFAKQTVNHFVLGISMTGIGSFLWLLLTLPLWPLHPMRNGLFRSLRGNRDTRGGASPLGTALLVLFVVVGLLKSLHLCWRLTRKTAHIILTRAESGILEVRV